MGSAYGCVCSSTNRPGGVRVTKIEQSTPPPSFSPWNSAAVGLSIRSSSRSVIASGRASGSPAATQSSIPSRYSRTSV